MAPEHSANTGHLWSEKNRHSHRLFNKSVTKLDISTVNNKIDFMKSLDLLCIKNTKESISKINWEVLLPKNSLPLKKCSVVISDVKCDICGLLIKNQIDMEQHKNSHRRLKDSELKSNNNTKTILNNYIENSTVEDYIECINNNNNNVFIHEDEIKTHKNNVHKKNKDSLTKVTLKIGGEVISKVYCKKKYLTKLRTKRLKVSGVERHEDCENCNKIKDVLSSNKMNANIVQISPCQTKQTDTDQTNRNIARLRKMAAALVEHELRQNALRNLDQSKSLGDEEEGECNDSRDSDAIVPEFTNESINSMDLVEDDDIQEILCITRDVRKLSGKNVHCINMLSSTKDCEVITIDDEICDTFEDDCVIIDERIYQQSCLKDQENSYVFHISRENSSNVSPLDSESEQISEKRKSVSNCLVEDENLLKKRKIEDKDDLNCTENLSTCEIEKENRNCQGPAIKLSQFALPLRLINF